MQSVKGKRSWIRACEHSVLRLLSVVFSAVSAHAILWFYSSMDKVVDTSDPFQAYVKWGLAIGFTALGYFLSRGLVHRMLNKERILVYMVLFGLLELVEFSANFSQAAVAVASVGWLSMTPLWLHPILQTMVYLVLPITPLFTVGLAVVDMDMDRAKQGYVVHGFGASSPSAATVPMTVVGGTKGQVAAPVARPAMMNLPKQPVPSSSYAPQNGGFPTSVLQPSSAYPAPIAMAPSGTPAQASARGNGQGNALFNFWNGGKGHKVAVGPDGQAIQ